ncbi:type 1 glutamine amidotransferase domain-containing protein [Sporomusa sp. KB1]|jgi:putative intracellular protease/amidase|uniref:type 1 glutamine amidotransferase domain-containing protein n=1 Tax=Sporomusa sp. KB1 TaxID=943346 RepID=UPI0011A331A0|nr:type 1 glutamine amidotransferase domain-containing protein [Sporomusa sp. KB1]TWH45760.1 putative intracellular protease/amidase [Sporomusa sp. KB1]
MQPSQKILMIVTSRDYSDKVHKIGLWMEEFAVPYLIFRAAGYGVAVASPLGGVTPIDPNSIKGGVPAEWSAAAKVLQSTVKLSQVDYTQYAAVVVPGGHGLLFDLAGDPLLANILNYFDSHNYIIAAVCHGPAGLISATTTDGKPLVAGRRMTGFTNEEERIGGGDKMVPFALETKLRELGADFVSTNPWGDYVVVDGNLITGQNPQSSDSFAKAILEALSRGTVI